MDPISVLDSLHADQNFWQLDVPTQMEVASRELDPALNADPNFQSLDLLTQRLVKNRLVAQAPTFQNIQLSHDLKLAGTDYLNGGSYGGTERTIYEGVQGAIAGSGILSFLRSNIAGSPGSVGDDDLKRGLDYYKALDGLMNRDSTPAAIGNFIGATAEAIGVSALMSPVTGLVSKAVEGTIGGGRAIEAGIAAGGKLATRAEAAGAFARAGMASESAATLHPALQMMGKIGADAVVTAAPFYLTDEMKRYYNGQPSIASEGYGEVLKTLGENAAINFVIGSLGVGALSAVGKSAKIVFGMKDAGNVVKGTYEANKDLVDAFMATGDPILLAKMDPIVRDATNQRRNILAYIREGVVDPDVAPLVKTQWLAQNTGKIVGTLDNGTYRVWEYGKGGEAIDRVYANLNDATNYLSYKTYKEWSLLDDAGKAKWPPNGLEWSIKRGESLSRQEDLISARDASVDPMLEPYGSAIAEPRQRVVVTKGEADFFSSSTGDYIGVQAHLPLEGSIADNAKSGEFNLFKGSDSVRVSPSDDPNVVLVGTKPASEADYLYATAKAEKAVQLDPTLSLEGARTSVLLDQGFDYYKHSDGSIEFFAPRNAKLIGTLDDVLSEAPSRMRSSGDVQDRIIVETETKAILSPKDFSGNSDAVLSATVKALRSEDPNDLLSVVKAYLEGYGIKRNIVAERSANLKAVQLFRDDFGGYHLRFPSVIDSPMRERQYVKQLFDHMKELTKGIEGTHGGTYFADRLEADVARFGFGPGFASEPWAGDVATQLGGTLEKADGSFTLTLPSGTRNFDSIDGVADFLAKQTADKTLVKKDLLLQGVRLSETKSGFVATYINSKKVVADKTLVGLMGKLNYAPKFVDRRFGPKEVTIGPDGISFDVAGTRVTKSVKEALQALDKFKDTNLLARQKLLKANAQGELSVDPTSNYRVYLSKYAYVKNFDNLADARKFIEQDVPKWRELQDIADKKGLDLTMAEDGRYKVREGANTYYATTKEELQAVFKGYPDVEESLPNILDGLDPDIEMQVAHVVAAHKQASLLRVGQNKHNALPDHLIDAKAKDLGAWMALRQYTSQKLQWFRDATQRADRPNLMKMIYRVQDARRLAERDAYIGVKLIDKIFRDDAGKQLPIESRQRIFYHAGQADDEATKALLGQYQAKFGTALPDLNASEQRALTRLNDMYDNFFLKSGIDARKFIHKYQPMLRDANLSAEFLNSTPNADALAQHVFKGNVPREVRFWAENERTNDIFNFAVKDDPLELILQYNSQMHKKMYLNPVWKDIVSYIDADKEKLGGPLIHQLNVWREQIMGYYHSPGEKVSEDIGTAFFRGIKKNPLFSGILKNVSQDTMEGYGRNMLRNALSLTYLTQMGFRPWVAIRNTLQPFTTLSMRYGVSWTLKAYDDVSKLGKDYFEHLRFLGILSDHPPIVDEVAFANTALGKLTRKGLQWMKNSDDLTRAVAYRTADLRFENALKFYNVDKDEKAFLTLSGLSISDPQKVGSILEQVRKGEYESAKDSFGFLVMRDTMFPNDAAESSLMRSGLIGKLFGQYGSYSEAYRANLFNILKYGSTADRVRMVATYLAICGTFSATFDELGIKTNDFVPGMPAVFTGGPAFYAGVDLIQGGKSALSILTGNATPFDKLNINKAQRDLTGYIPGGYQYNMFKKALDYDAQGDSWRSFLAWTGVPTLPPN
jgi:hypothetical protein